jgi:threonine/homoserine/homoserine lactone efflux protein
MLSLIAPLAAFSFVMSITPGPNNFMLLSSGTRFGLARSMPHMFGVTSGFIGLLAVVYVGAGTLMVASPMVSKVLAVACAVYLLWLALQLLKEMRRDPVSADGVATVGRPMTWAGAALFQFANPKAWTMAVASVTIVSNLALSHASRVLLLILVSGLINIPCIFLWTAFGAALRRYLHKLWVHRSFNTVMALMLALTAWWMIAPLLR